MAAPLNGTWKSATEIQAVNFDCGHCGAEAGPSRHYLKDGNPHGRILICPTCNRPTYVLGNFEEQVPGPLVGRSITGITDADVEKLYDEARKALAGAAPSAAVMVCRKLLMHVAVEQGADENKGFTYYAQYLSDQHIVGAPFGGVVTHIKNQGNKENHELEVSAVAEATMLLRLVEFVLASIYELPGMVPPEAPLEPETAAE